jgi:hypothetical protein
MSHHRDASADLQNERRRSSCLAHPGLGAHRQPVASAEIDALMPWNYNALTATPSHLRTVKAVT